jgi:hypothetical protein
MNGIFMSRKPKRVKFSSKFFFTIVWTWDLLLQFNRMSIFRRDPLHLRCGNKSSDNSLPCFPQTIVFFAWFQIKFRKFYPGANPTIMSYNASNSTAHF